MRIRKLAKVLMFLVCYLSFGSSYAVDQGMLENFPDQKSEESFVQQILPEDITPELYEDLIKGGAATTLWLHTSVKRTCYYLYDKHEHKTWVTSGSKSGPPYNVSTLTLTSWVGSSAGGGQDRSCNNCSSQDRIIEEYNLYCRMSCARGKIGSFSGRQVCVR